MFRRDTLQFYATAFAFAVVLHTCDWAIGQVFTTWAERFDRKEAAPVALIQEPVIAPDPPKPKVIVEVTDQSRQKLCKQSRECSKMAEALVYEARGESLKGAIAVGYVIVERTKNPTRWPKTVRGVINQKNQFSYTTRKQKVKPKPEDWERAYIASYQILNSEVKNPIGKSDHYHTIKVRPKWAKKMQYVATVGSHKFYRDVE